MATAKTTTTKVTTEEPTATGRTRSTVSQDGNAKCPACKETLPVTKFPTVRTESGYVRSTAECRRCRKSRRDANKAQKATATPAA